MLASTNASSGGVSGLMGVTGSFLVVTGVVLVEGVASISCGMTLFLIMTSGGRGTVDIGPLVDGCVIAENGTLVSSLTEIGFSDMHPESLDPELLSVAELMSDCKV